MQRRETRETTLYDPSSYVSILKHQPVQFFDPGQSAGVFAWGVHPTGDMQSTIEKVPLFPLNIVGTPGATRQLRIFEPRYRQMFQDIFNDGLGYNRTFGLVFFEPNAQSKGKGTKGRGLASVGCLMRVEMLQYENQRADRFMTWNLATERFSIRSLNNDQPYIVANAEVGYEDLPLVPRLVPECDKLEAKIEFLVRDILQYCIRWECKAVEKQRMQQLEPLANRCLKYSPQNRAHLPLSLSENKRREMFAWSVVDLISVGLQNTELQLMLQLRDVHARLVVLYELTQRTHLWVTKGDSVVLDLMSARLFR